MRCLTLLILAIAIFCFPRRPRFSQYATHQLTLCLTKQCFMKIIPIQHNCNADIRRHSQSLVLVSMLVFVCLCVWHSSICLLKLIKSGGVDGCVFNDVCGGEYAKCHLGHQFHGDNLITSLIFI